MKSDTTNLTWRHPALNLMPCGYKLAYTNLNCGTKLCSINVINAWKILNTIQSYLCGCLNVSVAIIGSYWPCQLGSYRSLTFLPTITLIRGWYTTSNGRLTAFYHHVTTVCRSHWPRDLSRSSTVARLLRSRFRIPPGSWMFVCCECCVLSGRGLCDELITRCVWVRNLVWRGGHEKTGRAAGQRL
jgi:hypothetical protein